MLASLGQTVDESVIEQLTALLDDPLPKSVQQLSMVWIEFAIPKATTTGGDFFLVDFRKIQPHTVIKR